MKIICFFLILVLIAGCKSQAKEELTIYSIQLIKKDRYNDDMLACCFTASDPWSFNKEVSNHRIKAINFVTARQLGIDFYGWKIAKYNLDSTVFVLGLFIPRSQITKMSDDSIALVTNKLKSAPQLDLILENEDTLRLYDFDFNKVNEMKVIFSVNDTDWVGISR
jgi:hypothetical protein